MMREPSSSSRHAWVEGAVLFGLLLPFYVLLLPRPGWPKVAGFVYLAALSTYMLFFSPHLRVSPEARQSLLEVPAVVCWCLFVGWVVLPAGEWGRRIGTALLAATVVYILFVSPRRHGDTLEDWGLGSLASHLTYLRVGAHRREVWSALALAHVVMVALCLLEPGIVLEVFQGALRKVTPLRLPATTPPLLLAALSLTLLDFTLACVIRYDNLARAARAVGLYLAGAWLVVAVAGYLYIYVYSGGWVELAALRGLQGVASYVLWGTLQELLFLGYFNTRIRKGIDSPLLSALLTAVVFSLFHLSAYTLMLLCFLVGIAWALVFQHAPNIFALGVSHGISGGFGSAFVVRGMTMFHIKSTVGPFNP